MKNEINVLDMWETKISLWWRALQCSFRKDGHQWRHSESITGKFRCSHCETVGQKRDETPGSLNKEIIPCTCGHPSCKKPVYHFIVVPRCNKHRNWNATNTVIKEGSESETHLRKGVTA